MHLTHRGRDVWYLRHADGAPHCASAGESMAHHLLKLELATAARAAGWSAEYEVAAPDGSWRADVLAQSPDGGRRTALEAQLSGISVAGIGMRTARYAADGMEVCWFTDRKRVPWLDTVPAVRIARPQDGGPLQVLAGAARFVPDWCADRADCRRTEPPGAGDDRPKDFRGPLPCGGHGAWTSPGPFPLGRFVAALCAGSVIRSEVTGARPGEQAVMRWVTPGYARMAEEEIRAAHARRRAVAVAHEWLRAAHKEQWEAALRRREEEERQRAADLAAEAAEREAREQRRREAMEAANWRLEQDPYRRMELRDRMARFVGPASDFLRHETGVHPATHYMEAPSFAGGLPLYVRGRPYAVICPVADDIPPVRDRLAALLLFAADPEDGERISRRAAPGQRVVVIPPQRREGV
ncbi:hypothetical protein ACFYNM_17590 [Streptomyces spororaveus]|uniref:competence protein CoiA family protein n=1 Tax=Streptomyces spororaveus TaxID=284039 RepID=UPI0036C640AC